MAADSGTDGLSGDSMMEFELPGEEKKNLLVAKMVEKSGRESALSSESSDGEKKSFVEEVRDLEL